MLREVSRCRSPREVGHGRHSTGHRSGGSSPTVSLTGCLLVHRALDQAEEAVVVGTALVVPFRISHKVWRRYGRTGSRSMWTWSSQRCLTVTLGVITIGYALTVRKEALPSLEAAQHRSRRSANLSRSGPLPSLIIASASVERGPNPVGGVPQGDGRACGRTRMSQTEQPREEDGVREGIAEGTGDGGYFGGASLNSEVAGAGGCPVHAGQGYGPLGPQRGGGELSIVHEPAAHSRWGRGESRREKPFLRHLQRGRGTQNLPQSILCCRLSEHA